MGKYSDLTREQLEAELDHRHEVISGLERIVGAMQSQNISLGIQVQTKNELLQKQEEQMMAYIAEPDEKL